MRRGESLLLAIVVSTSVLISAQSRAIHIARHPAPKAASTLPVTSHSAAARDLFEKGIAEFLNQDTDKALQNWRAAANADPNFALACAFISYATKDPLEERSARDKAKALSARVTPGEQLLIKWIVNVRENKHVAGIAALNDLLARYQGDKRLLYIAADWMLAQNNYERAKDLLDRALALDKDYAPALNDLGYVYAATRNFQPAFAAMEHYVLVLPNKPNPQDSYGEILRKGGNFQGALEHYRAALKIDPTFQSSLVGIADTYAVMGDEDTARKEYAKAIRAAGSISDRLQYHIQLALTYVREKKYGKANDVFEQIGEQARNASLQRFESEADQLMAMYQRDNNDSLRYADRAETALSHANALSQADMEEERSEILEVRAIRSAESGNTGVSHKALEQLSGLADASRSSKIQRSYDAAIGSVLVIEHKYLDAIPHLEEDNENPCSMQRLVVAYSESGAVDKAHALELKIASINEPTIEQALIVPELRAKLAPSKKRKFWVPRIIAH